MSDALKALKWIDDCIAMHHLAVEHTKTDNGRLEIYETIRAALTAQSETGVSEDGLLPCPFCNRKPAFSLSKKRGCQMHGDPIQYVILGCSHPDCPAKPHVMGGDRYRNGEGKYFKETEAEAKQEAVIKWNGNRTLPRTEDATDAVALPKEGLAEAIEIESILEKEIKP